jgi:hypothetical protein
VTYSLLCRNQSAQPDNSLCGSRPEVLMIRGFSMLGDVKRTGVANYVGLKDGAQPQMPGYLGVLAPPLCPQCSGTSGSSPRVLRHIRFGQTRCPAECLV